MEDTKQYTERDVVITQHPESGEYHGWTIYDEGDDWFSGAPIDGGMGYKFPKKYILHRGERTEMTSLLDELQGPGWREAIIDSGWHKPVLGYLWGNSRNGNRTWNGWANPAFPLESIKQLAEDFDEYHKTLGLGDLWLLNEEDWSLTIHGQEADLPGNEDLIEKCPPHSEWATIEVAGKSIKVLHTPGCYTWDEQ